VKQSRPCTACRGTGRVPGKVFDPCEPCLGTGTLEQRCNQCWKWKPVGAFIGAMKDGKAKVKANCTECGQKYWVKGHPSAEERAGDSRKGLLATGELRVFMTLESGNRKTGPIPVSMTSANSCPPSCSYFGAGCYAERHVLGMHWRRLSRGSGRTWSAFCDMVRKLPKGQLWRHNEAGDLPGLGEALDEAAMVELAGAARHTRGFTYTHKLNGGVFPSTHHALLKFLNDNGVTVNLSVDRFEDIDSYDVWGLPMTTVLPADAPRVSYTKAGKKVIVCPAQTNEGTTCASCGICQTNRPERAVVGFLAHGNGAGMISERLTPKRQLPLFSEKLVSDQFFSSENESEQRGASRPGEGT
jgi:hypothetical protein